MKRGSEDLGDNGNNRKSGDLIRQERSTPVCKCLV